MKTASALVMVVSTASFLFETSQLAQIPKPPEKDTRQLLQQEQPQHSKEANRTTQKQEASIYLKATELIGKKVQNKKGEELGEIIDLMVDLKQGDVVYAALSYGGVLGIGDKLFAVPLDALTWDANKRLLTVDVAQQELADASGFNKDKWPKEASPLFGGKTIQRSYGPADQPGEHPKQPDKQIPGSGKTSDRKGGDK